MQLKSGSSLVAVAVAVTVVLTGCAAHSGFSDTGFSQQRMSAREDRAFFAEQIDLAALNPPNGSSQSHIKASQAIQFIKKMDLPHASKSINAALQLDSRDSNLHFLNGFVYHLQARQGDAQKNELAVEGYRTALRIDPGNWIAQEFLGLAYLDLKQYRQAKEQFAQVLLMSPDTTVSMYGLMVASYLTGDAALACAMADSFLGHSTAHDGVFVRSSIAVYAACGRFDDAERMHDELRNLGVDASIVSRAEQRLSQWKDIHRSRHADAQSNVSGAQFQSTAAFTITNRPPEQKAQVPLNFDAPSSTVVPTNPSSQQAGSSSSSVPPIVRAASHVEPDTNGMVLVDVVIVSTQESVSTAKGINLLNALTLQLGSANAPGYSWAFDSSAASRTVITKAVTLPALAYSLNIANAASSTNEVLARPTIAAIEGQPSEFFAGVNVNAGVLSTTTLGSASVVPVDKRFGVKLAITPNFLSDGMVKLKVSAQRTFIVPNADNNHFAYRFDISETSTDANVVMRIGDTLVLGGLTEKENTRSRDGVPGLQDVPVAQYLFSSQHDVDFQRSALILITPRAPIYAQTESVQGLNDGERALRARLGFSAALPANVELIVDQMSGSELFRQFRQGDVAMARWDRTRTTADRLRQALSFLYY